MSRRDEYPIVGYFITDDGEEIDVYKDEIGNLVYWDGYGAYRDADPNEVILLRTRRNHESCN